MDERLDHQQGPSATAGSILTKTATVGASVTCVAFLHDDNERVVGCVYSQGAFLERVAWIHRDDNNNHTKDERQRQRQHQRQHRDRLLVWETQSTAGIHGIRFAHSLSSSSPTNSDMDSNTAAFKTWAVVFGGRHVSLLARVLPQQQNDNAGSELPAPMQRIPIHYSSSNAGSQIANPYFSPVTTSGCLQCSDWIWDVQWTRNPLQLLVGLAHNNVELWAFHNTPDQVLGMSATPLATFLGTKRCITYCLNFHPCLYDDNTMVAVGTAMQDIRVWTIPNNQASAVQVSTTIIEEGACLVGHQGVIHAVKWVQDPTHRQLVSASDDRSVRLWVATQQHTLYTWSCQWTGWGHTARIWDLAVMMSTSVVISTGEDGTARLWTIDSGKVCGVLRGHASQCIYSVDTTTNARMAVTGGNNGTIAFYDIGSVAVTGEEDSAESVITQRKEQQQHESEENSRSWSTVLVPDDRSSEAAVEPISADMLTKSPEVPAMARNLSSEVCREHNGGSSDGPIMSSDTEKPKQVQIPTSQSSPSDKKKKKKKTKKREGQVVFGMEFYFPNNLLIATRGGSLYSLNTSVAPAISANNSEGPNWNYLGSWDKTPKGRLDDRDHVDTSSGDPVDLDASSGCSMRCRVVCRDKTDTITNQLGHGCLRVAVGTTQGMISVLDFEIHTDEDFSLRRQFVLVAPQKYRSVQGLSWLRKAGSYSARRGEDHMLLSFHIDYVLGWSVQPVGTLPSDDSQPLWLLNLGTNAIPISFAFDERYHRLCVGDTRGNIAVFEADDDHSDSIETSQGSVISPVSILHRAHQKEHVTDMAIVRYGNNLPRLLSVGNDGCIHESFYDRDAGTFRKGISSAASSSLTGIVRVWADPLSSHDGTMQHDNIIVSGYYGNTFVVLNVSKGYELFRFDTGGRQRQITFYSAITSPGDLPAATEVGDTLFHLAVCTHQKTDGRNEVMLHRKRRPGRPAEGHGWSWSQLWRDQSYSLGENLHGESIFSATMFKISTNDNLWVPTSIALLTGSEDCTSKLSVYHDGSLIGAKQLPPQESCVRAVCSCGSNPATKTLLAVGGGKLTLQFFLVQSSEDARAVETKRETSDTHLVQGSLGYEKIQVVFLGNGKTSKVESIDHRINAVEAVLLDDDDQVAGGCVEEGGQALHLVAAGDSEGSCYLYRVPAVASEKRHTWTGLPLTLQKSSTKPILSIGIVKIRTRLLLLIGTTGGNIDVWDLPGTANSGEWDLFPSSQNQTDYNQPGRKALGVYQAHQMGVNSISASLTHRDEDRVLVVSGGDDQAISLCELRVVFGEGNRSMLEVEILRLVTVKEASSSAIKGVRILDDSRLVSVGYSQRLALWDFTEFYTSATEPLKLMSTVQANVGDVNCLTCYKSQQVGSKSVVAVGGAGVELYSIH